MLQKESKTGGLRFVQNLSEEESALLDEPCDLEDWEKHRILAVLRAVNTGNYFDLLRLPRTASRLELKRAYFALAKDFHPDRYYKRDVRGFLPLLERIFAATSQFVRTLGDSRTMTGEDAPAAGPRRRLSERHVVPLKATLRCQSWPQSIACVSHDISKRGAFVVTNREAQIGELLRFLLDGASGPALSIEGQVVSCRSADATRPAGIAIYFDALTTENAKRLLDLVSSALQVESQIHRQTEPNRRRMARGTGSVGRDPIIGIDLGTTNTSVSAAIAGKIQILKWPDGSYAIPSVVGFPERGRSVVGQEAKDMMLHNSRNVIASAKRLLGRHSEETELAGYLNDAQFKRENGPDNYIIANFWSERYAMPQICSYLLDSAREMAERNLGVPVGKAVLTVPVSFSKERIDLLKRSAKLAHLDVVDVIEEPSAAALANRNDPSFRGTVGVYDFGGGTFDFSLVDASGGDLRVLTTTGDSWLGGDDFDLALAEAAAELVWRVHNLDIRKRAVEWQYLVHSCEQAKRKLSVESTARVIVPEALRTESGASDLCINLARPKIEPFWASPINRSVDTCLQALALVGLSSSQLSAVYLSGGTSHIPLIRRTLSRRFGVPVLGGVSPDFAVCAGAGIHAAQLEHAMGTYLPSVG